MRKFQFQNPGPLVDGDLHLLLTACTPANRKKGHVHSYSFTMYAPVPPPIGSEAGNISLRIGDAMTLLVAGHVGYNVHESFRGKHFAGRACKLLLPLARKHGLDPLWITCDPDNIPSRRTCEWLGAEMVEIVPIPINHELYAAGQRLKCRYRLALGA